MCVEMTMITGKSVFADHMNITKCHSFIYVKYLHNITKCISTLDDNAKALK